jgi:hypothetical protein
MALFPVLGDTCELQFVMLEATMFIPTCLLILQNVFEKRCVMSQVGNLAQLKGDEGRARSKGGRLAGGLLVKHVRPRRVDCHILATTTETAQRHYS